LSSASAGGDLVDSDEEDAGRGRVNDKSAAKQKKRKLKEVKKDRGGERKKRREPTKEGARSALEGADADGEGEGKYSGDEYDSGDDVVKTADDERFIAEDDDLDEVAKEYDEEEQVRWLP
jgi:hypothetical protein